MSSTQLASSRRERNRDYASGGSAKSWAELLNSYDHGRKHVPWKAEEAKKPHVVTRYAVSRAEREFEPILQQYRDNARESTTRDSERAKLSMTLSNAKEKSTLKQQTFDIINHTSKLPSSFQSVAEPYVKNRRPETNTWYNIITNKDIRMHTGGAVDADSVKDVEEKPAEERATTKINSRPFNIMSNRYVRDHAQKARIDKQSIRDEAARKFWKSHDFNLVTCKFYDKEKEKRYRLERRALDKTHGSDRLEKLPSSYANREGELYNFITLGAIDGERLAKYDDDKRRLKDRMYSRVKVEEKQRRDAQRLAELGATRALNRTSYRRTEENFGSKHGYNIIDQRKFRRKRNSASDGIKSPKQQNVWEKTLQTSLRELQKREDKRPMTTTSATMGSSSHGATISKSPSMSHVASKITQDGESKRLPSPSARDATTSSSSAVFIPKLALPSAEEK